MDAFLTSARNEANISVDTFSHLLQFFVKTDKKNELDFYNAQDLHFHTYWYMDSYY